MTDMASAAPSPHRPEDSDTPDQAPPGYPTVPRPVEATPAPTIAVAPTEVLPAQGAIAPEAPAGPSEQAGWVPPPAPPAPPPQPLPPRPPGAVPPPLWPPGPSVAPQPPSPDPGGWGQPASAYPSPGYGPPGYGTPGYPPASGWQPGPAPAAAAPVARRPNPLAKLTVIAPSLLASMAISVGVVVLFFADLLIALGEPSGTRGNLRLLQFLSPGDLAVGAIMVVAVALVALIPLPDAAPASAVKGAAEAKLVAGVVAVAVGAAALVRAIVVLTISHQHVAVKLGNMIDALAAVIVAAAAAYWAFKPKAAR